MARSSRSVRRWLLAGVAVTLSVGIAALSLYLVVLDREVRARFASVRWVLPAQVYAAPVELYPGAALSLAELRHELDRLGYRAGDDLLGPGTYVAGRDALQIDTRAFTFWDGTQPEQRVVVRGDAHGLLSVRAMGTDRELALLRLDPMLIGSVYPSHGGEDRVLVKLDEVPPLLPKTLELVEDRDFEHHIGISFRGIFRAALANLRAGHTVQGASTLTQQLIKNLFLSNEQTFRRKITEIFMALLLERHVSKHDILEAYLNEVWLGQDGSRAIHGFGLASQFYFNKPLDELRPEEIAMLVAIVKGPTAYNPRRRPALVLARRNLVLHMMADAGLIRPDQLEGALARPLGVSAGSGGGVERYPAFIDLVRRQLQGFYRDEDLTEEGLRIFTTLNPHVQEILEQHIREDLADVEKAHRIPADTLQSAGVVTSVEGGEVLGLVGDRDSRYAGFNRALDARRPIGSLAKPFLYLTALKDGAHFNLGSLLDDSPVDVRLPNGDHWAPKNYDRQSHGRVPLFMALAKSYNLATVRLGLAVGVDAVHDTFQAAGFPDPPALPSMFLGAINMSPLDVAQVYSTLASGGYLTPLLAIREVTTRDGQPLSRYSFKLKQTLPEGPVYLTTWAMHQVFAIGTARWANSVLPADHLFAGKTGTTDDSRDSWFAGFGADRVTAIWVGRDDNKPIGLDGAGGALRIWARVMRDLNARGLDLTPPPDIEAVPIDLASDLRADAGCPDAAVLPFLAGSAPQMPAPCANARQSGPLDWLKSIFR